MVNGLCPLQRSIIIRVLAWQEVGSGDERLDYHNGVCLVAWCSVGAFVRYIILARVLVLLLRARAYMHTLWIGSTRDIILAQGLLLIIIPGIYYLLCAAYPGV